MSTPDSSRLKPVAGALAALAGSYILAMAGLTALAVRAEASGEVYPYRDEDWLRYLVPGLWEDRAAPSLLITGPSTARENILHEVVQAAFPGERVFQGAIAVGTISDVTMSLEYVEKAYGPENLPRAIILGLSPRFLADIPSERPFARGLDRYSRYYRPGDAEPGGYALDPKGRLEGLLDHVSFMTRKAQSRFAPALFWYTGRVVGADLSETMVRSPVARGIMGPVARLIDKQRLAELGWHAYGLERASPYKYRGATGGLTDQDIRDAMARPLSWWTEVHEWDPAAHADEVEARVERLKALARRLGISIYAVSLPEREVSLALYEHGNRTAYQTLLDRSFAGVPVLNLRCLLRSEEFLDAEHATPAGAARVTGRVVAFVKDARASSVPEKRQPESPWAAPCSFGSHEH